VEKIHPFNHPPKKCWELLLAEWKVSLRRLTPVAGIMNTSKLAIPVLTQKAMDFPSWLHTGRKP